MLAKEDEESKEEEDEDEPTLVAESLKQTEPKVGADDDVQEGPVEAVVSPEDITKD